MGLFSQFQQKEPLFAVVDLETTGLLPSRADRIVEIAVVTITPTGQVVDDLATLVDPERDIGPTSIHGLTARHVFYAKASTGAALSVDGRADFSRWHPRAPCAECRADRRS